jgi:hypothetical protein
VKAILTAAANAAIAFAIVMGGAFVIAFASTL